MKSNYKNQSFVNGVFSSVASKYDLMNDLMSGGLHRLWRKKLLPYLTGTSVLDIACGTGDVSMMMAKKGYKVAACDINMEMLRYGIKKSTNEGLIREISWTQCSADSLPFTDSSFDSCTIAFGMRNIENRHQALLEILRVLRPGGKFVCMEFTPTKNSIISKGYDAYSRNIIPLIGKIITGNKEAYEYLAESINLFPEPEEFAQAIREVGFVKTDFEIMNLGIIALHYASKGH